MRQLPGDCIVVAIYWRNITDLSLIFVLCIQTGDVSEGQRKDYTARCFITESRGEPVLPSFLAIYVQLFYQLLVNALVTR